ncbi:Tetratricopeptide TPR_2 repeat protein [Geobacter metallireducens RCH3]|uniref:TPR domain protein n=1 Tax=Geobacter metallireducens (strain ATCC 53774 / DSM 7210 / GS-15) TaxID=269799 RepID=Q39UB3_GEOMG|nr:tetratricopeptide repeat protein [Geobacter metallireducens]ABB32161.1 TPR domain protein [Geobacter metallireducens GS-15]EHP88649.1 Tetratricopeptide TPR_2 repeat protein [Geobacter metallireducens RCH3]
MRNLPACILVILCLLCAGEPLLSPVAAADPFLHNKYGVDLIERGEIEKAIEQLEKAYSLYSSDPILKGNLATAYALQGQRLLDRKSYADAAGQFEKALVLFPDEPRYHLLRGIAFTLAKNFPLARHELQQARNLGGETAEGLYFLGRIHYEEGETDEALQNWEKAAALAPSDPSLAKLLERMRREQAVETRMERGHSSRFIVSYDAGEVKTGIALDVLDVLETAYNSVGTDLGYFPEARVPVILYTKRDYREVTRSPNWSGGLYDGKIRIPIGGLVEITPDLRATLRHEYTHAVVRDLSRGNCPVWLNEGLAELQGRQELNPPLTELGRAIRTGGYLPLRKLENGFTSLGSSEVRLAYEESYAVVNFMVSSYGWYRVRGILTYIGEGLPVGEAINRGLADLGLDYDGVFGEWLEYMKREYGGEKQG